MDWTFYNNTEEDESNDIQQHTADTFKALVELIIPRTPRLAELYGDIQFFGALDFETYDFIILSLNSYCVPLAEPMAELLDMVAKRLVVTQGKENVLNFSRYPQGGIFAALPSSIRLYVLAILRESRVYFTDLPVVFQNYPELILFNIRSLNRLTMMGYYSEWFGYGTTRLNPPDQRVLEFTPLSWEQIEYPGPSFSYRTSVMDYYMRRKPYE